MKLGLLYRIMSADSAPVSTRSGCPYIGVVLDGHRRYACEEGLASYQESYRHGMQRFEQFLDWSNELQIPVVTACCSPENLSRPADELLPYFEVLEELFARLPSRRLAVT